MRNFNLWQSIVQEASTAPMALVKFLCCVYATKTFFVDVTYCPGPSMLPTMNTSGSGDVVLADRFSPRLGRIGRGDIVVVRSPENPRKLITKRIIAMENDNITFLVDPLNSDKSEFQKDMYGYKEITFMLLEIQETLGLCLTVLSTGKYFGESGRLKILDRCDRFSCADGQGCVSNAAGVVDMVAFFVLHYFYGHLFCSVFGGLIWANSG